MKKLAARSPSRFSAGHRYSLADPRFLLRVITEEWRVFEDSLSRVEQGFAAELRDVGNRWAHGDQFSDDDTYRTLDTMERLLASSAGRDAARPERPAAAQARSCARPRCTPAWGPLCVARPDRGRCGRSPYAIPAEESSFP